MPRSRLLSSLTTVLGLAVAGPGAARAGANPSVHQGFALDYQAEPGCALLSDFAATVSDKTGYMPWSVDAEAVVRVRMVRDGERWLGSIAAPDGSSRQLSAPDCAQLGDLVSSALAMAIDGPYPLEPTQPAASARAAGPSATPVLPPAVAVMPTVPDWTTRWDQHTPAWVILGGTATAVAGALLVNLGVDNVARADRFGDADARSRGTVETEIGVGLALGGGAVIVTGLWMSYVNVPRPVTSTIQVAPAVLPAPGAPGSSAPGLTISGGF